MGHNKIIATFDEKIGEKRIQAEVNDWAYRNIDLEEQGFPNKDEFSYPVRFKSITLNSYEEAEAYLEKNTDRDAIAVRYKEYPEVKSKKATDLKRRIDEYNNRINELDRPHYEGVKQATVKCKHCGASLPTKYCGASEYLGGGKHRGFKNNCPVCGEDLRPQSVLDKISKYRKTIAELAEQGRDEVKAQNEKNAKKAKIKWAVCVDVHC